MTTSFEPIDPTTWTRVKEICADAMELEGAEREAFVEERCTDDPRIESEVRRLLAAHERIEPDFLEPPSGGPLALALPFEVGRRIGPWRLVDELGTGGMGVVYLAERLDADFEQRSALKVMRLPTADAALTGSFHRERQVLAGLEHPNIAHLLDGGNTEEGLPYFAMEFVEGLPIDRFCDEHELSTDDRLALFLEVCSAVSHAHRNLVVHRDLKPSNILVTSNGAPKLLDFGIAKLLAEGPGDAAVTQFQALTPDYASPEQLRGEAITTASDVYSLGALLYRLLTGQKPFTSSTKTLAELSEERGQSPRSPSAVASEAAARELRGDLDSIVMKALRPEADQRYGSVEALAEDLSRYRDGLAVGARQGTFFYLFGKLLRRHKVQVAAAALVALSLVGATVASTRAAQIARAERATAQTERAKAERISAFLQGMISSPDASWLSEGGSGRDVTVVQVLEQAEQSHDAATEAQPAEEALIRRTLGITYRSLGLYDASERLLREAVRLDEQWSGAEGFDLGLSLAHLAVTLFRNGDYEGATRLGRRVVDIFRSQPIRPGADKPGIELSGNVQNLGLFLLFQGQLEEAEVYLDEALTLSREHFGDTHPIVAITLTSLGNVRIWQGDLDGAETFYRSALDTFSALPNTSWEPALTWADIGRLEVLRGNHDKADEYLGQAMEIVTGKLGEEHPQAALIQIVVARLRHRQGRLPEAEQEARSAFEILEHSLGKNHPHTATAQTTLGSILTTAGRPAEAEDLLRRALEKHRNAQVEHRTAQAAVVLGECLAALGQRAEAAQLIAEGVAGLEATLGAEHVLTREAKAQLRLVPEAAGLD